jgi:dUTP pyrophosphatase
MMHDTPIKGSYIVKNGKMTEYELKRDSDGILNWKEKHKMKVVIDDGAYLPERAHETDAGLDIRSPRKAVVFGHDSIVIDSGVHIEIPRGFVGFLKSKSGLNVKHGITSEGVIDCGYTGSIKVKLYNNSSEMYKVERGDKISQLVILPILTPELEEVESLEETERGDNGFGSTGK